MSVVYVEKAGRAVRLADYRRHYEFALVPDKPPLDSLMAEVERAENAKMQARAKELRRKVRDLWLMEFLEAEPINMVQQFESPLDCTIGFICKWYVGGLVKPENQWKIPPDWKWERIGSAPFIPQGYLVEWVRRDTDVKAAGMLTERVYTGPLPDFVLKKARRAAVMMGGEDHLVVVSKREEFFAAKELAVRIAVTTPVLQPIGSPLLILYTKTGGQMLLAAWGLEYELEPESSSTFQKS